MHAEWLGNKFTLIDTGGLDFEKNDEISSNIVKQAKLAIEMADVVIFLTDINVLLSALAFGVFLK